MILSQKPLSLAEVKEYTKSLEEKKPIVEYLKKFSKLNKSEADKIAEEIRALNNPKLNEDHIIRILDFMPGDLEDMNKILSDAGLSEEEANAILGIVNK